MENASKALLIAASILIAIALIAIGIRILSATSGVTKQVDSIASSLETSIYNSQFTKYEGEQKGSDVKVLLRLIKNNNINNSNKIDVYIVVNGEHRLISDSDIERIGSQISSNSIGYVSFATNNRTGLINSVLLQ